MKSITDWFLENWQISVISFLLIRSFFNNLLANCPFLKANKGIEVIQGIFDALIQTALQGKIKIDHKGEES